MHTVARKIAFAVGFAFGLAPILIGFAAFLALGMMYLALGGAR